MPAPVFKRTKIIATIGPVSAGRVADIVAAGANALRYNFAHADYEAGRAIIASARQIEEKLGKPVAVIGDLQGPKLRVGKLPASGIELTKGRTVTFACGSAESATATIPIVHDISRYLSPGQPVFLRDGLIELEVTTVKPKLVTARIKTTGTLFSHQGANLPEADLGGEILTAKDEADIDFAISNDMDFLALSFVQTAADVERLKQRLLKAKSTIGVIAKIETKAAISNLREIVAVSDGVLVARGDLAIEAKAEAVPVLQQRTIDYCRQAQKPVIVATQMLESMVSAPQPTRAEVSDVAVAVMEGADAVMLSAETAVGSYPVEAVQTMKRVIRYTEDFSPSELRINFNDPTTRANAISAAAIILARQMGAKLIIAETTSGQTARNLASFRPPVPIIMVTHRRATYHQLALVWGGKVFLNEEMAGATERTLERLKAGKFLKAGDTVVVTSGHHPGVTGGTDSIRLCVVS